MSILYWKLETLTTDGNFVVNPVFPLTLTAPTSAVQDPLTGNIFAVEPSLHRIVKINSVGTVTVLTNAFNANSLLYMYFAAGFIWLGDTGGGVIGAGQLLKVDPNTGVITTIATGLTDPYGLCVTADGATAFVACMFDYFFGLYGSNLVEIDTGTGIPIDHFQYPRGGFNSWGTQPQGVTFGPGSEQFIHVNYTGRSESIDQYNRIGNSWATISLITPGFFNTAGMAMLPSGTDPTNIYMVHEMVGTGAFDCIGCAGSQPTIQSVNFGADTFAKVAGAPYDITNVDTCCNAGWYDCAHIPIPPPNSNFPVDNSVVSLFDAPYGISQTTFQVGADGAFLIVDTHFKFIRRLTPVLPAPPPPPPPPPGATTTVKVLGCGNYTVFYAQRGGAIKGLLPGVTKVDFTRKLNDISDCTIELGGGAGGIGGFSSSCCAAINKITCLGANFAVELLIYRNTELAWSGPLTDIILNPDSGMITLKGKDLFTLFDHRFWHGVLDRTLPYPYIKAIIANGGDVNPDLDATDTDIVNIFMAVAYDAIFPEPTSFTMKVGIHNANTNVFDLYDFTAIPDGDSSFGYTAITTGFTAQRYISATQYVTAGQVLRETSQQGVDFTIVNRVLYVGNEQISRSDIPIGIFTDAAFQKAPQIHIVGTDLGTRFVVGANGTGTDGPNDVADTATPNAANGVPLSTALPSYWPPGSFPANDPVYGLLETYDYIGDIKDTWNNGGTSKGPSTGLLIRGVSQPYYPSPNSIPAGADPDGYSVWQGAVTRYQQFSQPYGIVEQAQLKDSAPFTMSDLIPGVHVGVRLSEACVPILENYRLRDVSVSATGEAEAVSITLIPLGTTVYGPGTPIPKTFGNCS